MVAPKKSRKAAASQAPAGSAIQATNPAWPYPNQYGNNGHQGAQWRTDQPYIYFPQLDVRKEIDPLTRTEEIRRARFFESNTGLGARVLECSSRMVAGTGIRPQAAATATNDRAAQQIKEFNRASDRYIATLFGSAYSYDVAGRLNFATSQPVSLRLAYRDGDMAKALTESAAGHARFAFYEGHNIGNGPAPTPGFGVPKPGPQWFDGIQLEPGTNRMLGARFLDPDDRAQFTDIAARDMVLLARRRRGFSQPRGLSMFDHAIHKLASIDQIGKYLQQGIAITNSRGYIVTQAAGAPAGPATADAVGDGGVTTTEIQDGDGNTIKLKTETITGGGMIPTLSPGRDIKVINDARPNPNQMAFLEWLIRDIALGSGLSFEVIWNMAALGGAGARFVLADAQSWVETEQLWFVGDYCQRDYVYAIAKGIKVGAIPKPVDGLEWWKARWLPPPRLTVDFGRDGRTHIEMLKMGAITYSQLLGWQSEGFEHHINTWLDEIATIKAGLNETNAQARTADNRNLTWDDVAAWRNINAQPQPDTGAETDLPGTGERQSADAITDDDIVALHRKDPARFNNLLKQMGANLPAAA